MGLAARGGRDLCAPFLVGGGEPFKVSELRRNEIRDVLY